MSAQTYYVAARVAQLRAVAEAARAIAGGTFWWKHDTASDEALAYVRVSDLRVLSTALAALDADGTDAAGTPDAAGGEAGA